MTSPPVALTKCPACQGPVRAEDTRCKWCLSPLRTVGPNRQSQAPARPSLTWSRVDQSYMDHAAWKVSLSPDASVLVQEGETASLTVDGELQGTLPTGLTQISSLLPGGRSAGRLEIVFSKVALAKFKWGHGDLTTSDGITIGAHGTISIQQGDPRRFLQQIPRGQQHLSNNDLRDSGLREIRSALVSQISKGMVSEIQRDPRRYEDMVKRQLISAFDEIGLVVTKFEILNLSLPEEYLRAAEKPVIRSLEAHAEATKLEELKRVGVDVTRVATIERAVERGGPAQLVVGDYVAGSVIQDSVVVRSSIGTGQRAEDSAVTGELTVPCPYCKTTLTPLTHKFCFECGARVRACPKCRIAIPAPGKFCYQCGDPLPQDVQAKIESVTIHPS